MTPLPSAIRPERGALLRRLLPFAILPFAICLARAALYPRIQCDILVTNAATALAISNKLASTAATNFPRLVRTVAANATFEPGGIFRFSCVYEFTNATRASNVWSAATNNIPNATTGRIIFYWLPEEGDLSDWAGADRDPRAQRQEVTW